MFTTIKRVTLACGVLGVLGALAAAAPAMAATQQAQAGELTATFTFSGTYPNIHHPTLTIANAGTVVYRHAVRAKLCGAECAPGSFDASHPSVQFVNLDGSATPKIMLSLFSGGAHCCSIAEVFTYNPATRRVSMAQHNFGDPGMELQDLAHNGQSEFVTADDRFAYRFTDFAASGVPIQVLAFQHGRFVDVTAQYPTLIRADAASWLKAYKGRAAHHWVDSVGVFAAWAADEELLGQAQKVERYLAAQAKAGHLNSVLMPHSDSGQAFVSDLEMFLDHTGYISQMCGGG